MSEKIEIKYEKLPNTLTIVEYDIATKIFNLKCNECNKINDVKYFYSFFGCGSYYIKQNRCEFCHMKKKSSQPYKVSKIKLIQSQKGRDFNITYLLQ